MMHPDADNAIPAAAASSTGARNDLRVPPFAFISVSWFGKGRLICCHGRAQTPELFIWHSVAQFATSCIDSTSVG